MSTGIRSQIAPKGLHFSPSEFFISDKYATILTVVSYPKYIQPGYLSSLTNMPGIKVVAKHIPVPFQQMSKMLNKQVADLKERYQNERDSNFIDALIQEDVTKASRILQDVLLQSISYYDNYESFYHGFMVGFLNADGYEVKSNRESGEGRFDLAVLPYSILNTAIVIECKHSNSIKELRKDSKEASNQIIEKRYIEGLRDEGYENVIGYGISFYKKQCIITKAYI